jgi:hypothetical protein
MTRTGGTKQYQCYALQNALLGKTLKPQENIQKND